MKSATLSFEKNEDIKECLQSLVPEADEGMRRVEIDLSFGPPQIIIDAEDTRALRAALNSYLRWLNISEKIFNDIN